MHAKPDSLRLHRASTLALALAAAPFASAQLATFEILSAPGPIKEHRAETVSFDGSVVGGFAGQMDGNWMSDVYIWTEQGGMTIVIDGLANVAWPPTMAPNGSAIVGTYMPDDPNIVASILGFRATLGGGMTNLLPVQPGDPAENSFQLSYGMAASNTFSFGFSDVNSGAPSDEAGVHVKRWSGSVGTRLPWPAGVDPAADTSDFPVVASANGSVVAGAGVLTPNGSTEFRALVWENDQVQDLPKPAGVAMITGVSNMSTDGRVIVGLGYRDTQFTDPVGLKWEKFSGAWIVTELTTFFPALISNDCSRMLGGTLQAGQKLWVNGVIFDVKTYVSLESGEILTSYSSFFANDLSADGSTLVGVLVDSRGDVKSWRFRGECSIDTDDDGLLDCWETVGVRYLDENGEIQLYVLSIDGDDIPDGDPEHKDLYLEVDEDADVTISPVDLDRVVTAFANAPVDNPDGVQGIDLHILCDDLALPLPEVWALTNCWPTDYETIRFDWFGTQSERDERDNMSEILDAKARAFRYAVIAQRLSDGSLGIAEDIHSDDFIFAMGEPFHTDGIHDSDDVAGTFMHELGHCLGLGHGGHDDILGKPNYPSIMNYMYADRMAFNTSFWTLDYSRAGANVFPTLDENDLDESSGIASGGLYGNWVAPFGVTRPDGSRDVQFVRLNGSMTDFGEPLVFDGNTDGEFDMGIVQDLNFIGSALPVAGANTPSPSEVLEPHDDWANLRYEVVDGSTNPAPRRGGELTGEAIQWINTHVVEVEACPGDANGDQMINFADITDVLGNWLSDYTPDSGPGDANSDGLVNFSDITSVLANWLGACP